MIFISTIVLVDFLFVKKNFGCPNVGVHGPPTAGREQELAPTGPQQ